MPEAPGEPLMPPKPPASSKSSRRSLAAKTGNEPPDVIILGQEPSSTSDTKRRQGAQTKPAAGPSNLAPSTLVAAADHAAHGAFAPGEQDLVREKLAISEPSELRRKGFFSDAPDKWLFMAFAFLGFVGIFTAKGLGLPGLPVALAAVGLLFVYAFVAYWLDAFRSNPDRLGDNCYYMGFLFTLSSLSAALVALQRDAGTGRGDLLEGLIGGFGIALFSTIAGITLRVFFMQMRREIEDLEEQLRTELQRSAALLKHQLSEAVMDLENFRLRTQEVMHKQMDGAASGFSGMAEKLIAYVATAGTAYSLASERLAENADRVAADVGRLADRVERIEIPADLLTRQVDDARGRIEALASALEAAVEAGGSRQMALEQSSRTLDALLLRLTDVAVFGQVEGSAERLGQAMGSTSAKVAELGEQLSAYASSVSAIAAQAEKHSQTLSRVRRQIYEDLQQSTAALHKLQGTLADVADGLVARVTAPLGPDEGGPRPKET